MEIFDAVRSEPVAGDDISDNKDLKKVLEILNTEPEASSDDRRKHSRSPYVVSAVVELSDPMGHTHRIKLFSRDANQWGVGFVSQAILPVGPSALIQLKGGDGVDVRAIGCIVRCREVLPDWYEGAILFQNEQPSLAESAIKR